MANLNIELKLFITFKKYLPDNATDGKATVSMAEGATLADLLNRIGLPLAEPKIIILNGVSQGTTDDTYGRPLQNGDTVSIFPPVGGG